MNEVERTALRLYLGETAHVCLPVPAQIAREALLVLVEQSAPMQYPVLTIRSVLTVRDHFIGWPSLDIADAHALDVRGALRSTGRYAEAELVEVRLNFGGKYAVGIKGERRKFSPLIWTEANGDQRPA